METTPKSKPGLLRFDRWTDRLHPGHPGRYGFGRAGWHQPGQWPVWPDDRHAVAALFTGSAFMNVGTTSAIAITWVVF